MAAQWIQGYLSQLLIRWSGFRTELGFWFEYKSVRKHELRTRGENAKKNSTQHHAQKRPFRFRGKTRFFLREKKLTFKIRRINPPPPVEKWGVAICGRRGAVLLHPPGLRNGHDRNAGWGKGASWATGRWGWTVGGRQRRSVGETHRAINSLSLSFNEGFGFSTNTWEWLLWFVRL